MEIPKELAEDIAFTLNWMISETGMEHNSPEIQKATDVLDKLNAARIANQTCRPEFERQIQHLKLITDLRRIASYTVLACDIRDPCAKAADVLEGATNER
ncbi:MAG: hypothetical protein D4S01_10530 [Dehalococcoidia bacterium]|nr:MAG: hypothetical protein D4S01_10530 [Dehalococcoidia bacterium]